MAGPTPEGLLTWFPVIVRYGAILGVAHQAIFAQFDRPYLLALYGGALGLNELAQAIMLSRKNGGK